MQNSVIKDIIGATIIGLIITSARITVYWDTGNILLARALAL